MMLKSILAAAPLLLAVNVHAWGEPGVGTFQLDQSFSESMQNGANQAGGIVGKNFVNYDYGMASGVDNSAPGSGAQFGFGTPDSGVQTRLLDTFGNGANSFNSAPNGFQMGPNNPEPGYQSNGFLNSFARAEEQAKFGSTLQQQTFGLNQQQFQQQNQYNQQPYVATGNFQLTPDQTSFGSNQQQFQQQPQFQQEAQYMQQPNVATGNFQLAPDQGSNIPMFQTVQQNYNAQPGFAESSAFSSGAQNQGPLFGQMSFSAQQQPEQGSAFSGINFRGSQQEAATQQGSGLLGETFVQRMNGGVGSTQESVDGNNKMDSTLLFGNNNANPQGFLNSLFSDRAVSEATNGADATSGMSTTAIIAVAVAVAIAATFTVTLVVLVVRGRRRRRAAQGLAASPLGASPAGEAPTTDYYKNNQDAHFKLNV